MKKLTRKKKIIIASSMLILIFLVIPMIATTIIYEGNFGERSNTPEYLKYEMSSFKNIKRTEAPFKSNNGQILAGYIYNSTNNVKPKAIIVVAHGIGGGHNTYIPEIDYIVQHGYTVFAYDCTGTDDSEGKSIIGLPQGIIDLDNALNFVENNNDLKELPIMLYGHSWGGYSVCSELNYNHKIKGVVERSGFNESQNIITEQGSRMYGSVIKLLSPYIRLYEKIKFGDVSKLNSLDGLKKTDANVMLMHSSDDTTVSYKNNFQLYEDELREKSNLKFVPLTGLGHDVIIDSKFEYMIENNKKKLIDKYGSKKNIPKSEIEVFDQIINKQENKINTELMDEIITFYDKQV